MSQNISFSFEYILSIIVIVVVINILMKKSPGMNIVVIILTGLVTGWLSLTVFNVLLPNINKFGSEIKQYYLYQFSSRFNDMGYINIWPPILILIIVFAILLFNRNLG